MLTRIGDVLPRCRVYQSLFPTMTCCCTQYRWLTWMLFIFAWMQRQYFGDSKARRLVSHCSTPFSHLCSWYNYLEGHFTTKLLWKDFSGGFARTLGEFRNHVKNIEREAGISNMIEASHERDLMRAIRVEDEIQNNSKFGSRTRSQI